MKLLLTTIAAVLLVGCGPSVDIWTAADEGNIKAVKQHLAAGMDVDARGGVRGETPLHSAAANDHKELAELLIAKGADVSAKGDGERTPLHEAATYGHKEVAELLIAAGADVNAEITSVKFRGETALDWAIAFKETELADLLRKHGGKTGEELRVEGK